MPDQAQQTAPEALPPEPEDNPPGAATTSRGNSSGAAASVTEDNADAGEWPDDIASDRGSSSKETGRASSTPPDVAPLQKDSMSDGTKGLPVPPLDADEVAARANFG